MPLRLHPQPFIQKIDRVLRQSPPRCPDSAARCPYLQIDTLPNLNRGHDERKPVTARAREICPGGVGLPIHRNSNLTVFVAFPRHHYSMVKLPKLVTGGSAEAS